MILALHWQKNKKENFFTRIAYEYGGPMCYAYMRWVEQEVLKEGIETLLFIARDGYSLKKIFDNFEHSNIQTFYVYAPRKLAINCKNNEKDFLEYKKYIERLNIQGKNIAIVDTITENFSAQSLLIKTLADKNIKGFYWNIVSSKNSNDLNYKKKQWGERSNHSGILCWDFIEYMMTSPEAPILKIENLKVLHKKDITKEEIKRQKLYPKISNSIIQFQSDIKFFNSFSYSLIKEWTNLLFSNANKKEKNSISKIRCAYDSNHKNYRSMYSFPKINKGKKYLAILNIPLLKIKEKTFYSSKYKTMLIKKKIKIIGIPLLKVEKANWFYKIYFCRIKLLSYKKNNDKKKISFLGIPLIKITGFKLDQKAENLNIELKQFIKNNSSEMIKQINRLIEKKLSTFHLHQKTFLKFKGINRGKDVVIVATGPTLSKFKQIKEAIYIGVNRAYQFTDVHFNYYFIQDFSGETPNYIDDVYRYRNCIKFIGLTAEDSDPRKTIPEKYSLGNDIYRYRTDWENIENFKTKFSYDLSTTALGCGGTVVLPALQFALYTQPKRIYLVGVDTSNSGYFNSKTKNILFPELLKQRYIELKNFAEQYYPDIEIISINPVGLKGIFKDVYTETPSNEI